MIFKNTENIVQCSLNVMFLRSFYKKRTKAFSMFFFLNKTKFSKSNKVSLFFFPWKGAISKIRPDERRVVIFPKTVGVDLYIFWKIEPGPPHSYMGL